jgi:hypothetical protein
MTQRNEYTKKALKELREQMKEQDNDESEDDIDHEERTGIDRIIDLATKNSELKSRIDKHERTIHYLKLDLSNVSCDLSEMSEKLELAESKLAETKNARKHLSLDFFICVLIMVVGFFFTSSCIPYFNDFARVYLLACVECYLKKEKPFISVSVSLCSLIIQKMT